MTNRHPCPSCGRPLNIAASINTNTFSVWCASAVCPSEAATDGASADSIDRAVKLLGELVAAGADGQTKRKDEL
jgi:hypothetical protein